MNTKKRYPKSFYDEGLGDFLEWIDDEVLIHSEARSIKEGKSRTSEHSKRGKSEKKNKIYGENEPLKPIERAHKKVKLKLDEEYDEFDPSDVKVDKKLDDRTRGLVNRLSAQTMPFVTSELEKLYSTFPKSQVNGALFSCIESSIIFKYALAKRKMIAELMLLVSYLSSKLGQDIGASWVHRLIRKFENLYVESDENNMEDKQMENILLCLVNLYTIGLINANLIFEVAKRICSSNFHSKSIELITIVLQSVGFQMRKDSPSLMRQLILMAQDRSNSLKSNGQVGGKIEFMVEALAAIKNNNVNKLNNYGCDVDKDTIESTLKSLIRRTKLPEALRAATYDELLHSSNWYLLDTRVGDDQQDQSTKKNLKELNLFSKKDLKICKALGFNKPSERTIFSALLRASDFIEASNIIIGFGNNHCSDAMVVLIHVAIHEKKYNPFYFNLINNLCKFNRRYKMAAKFSIQDKIRTLSQTPSERVDIFKQLCLELIKSDAIPITILKAVEWADISESTKEYLVFLFENISNLPEDENKKIMSKVEKRSSFAGAMRTFTNCFMKGCILFQ